MIIAEFSIIPLGTKSTSVSRYVKVALEGLKREDMKVEVGAMSTVVEANDLKTLFNAVEKAHEAVFRLGVKRVVTEIKIDDRRDKKTSIEKKIKALR